MSIGMHCRLLGRPGRFRALQRFLDYVQQHERVWVCTRQQIADHWREVHPFQKCGGCALPGLQGGIRRRPGKRSATGHSVTPSNSPAPPRSATRRQTAPTSAAGGQCVPCLAGKLGAAHGIILPEGGDDGVAQRPLQPGGGRAARKARISSIPYRFSPAPSRTVFLSCQNSSSSTATLLLTSASS
jgi:hypothetical protein